MRGLLLERQGRSSKFPIGEMNGFRPLEIRKTNPADLRSGHQIWHGLKVVGREISIASRLDLRQSFVNLRTEFPLAILVLGQLPESKGQLEGS